MKVNEPKGKVKKRKTIEKEETRTRRKEKKEQKINEADIIK